MLMKLHAFLCILLFFSVISKAQKQTPDITIEVGKENIALNQPFTITVVVKNSENRPTIMFPDLEGLEKRSASATTTMSTVGGKTVLIQTKVQQYFAVHEGTYEIPPFTVTVNGTKVRSEGLTVTFTKSQPEDSSTDLFSEDQELTIEETASEEIALVVSVNKTNVFIREGFSVRLALYVSESTPVEMEFYKLDAQLQAILKKLRPPSCWEENLGLDEVVQREVLIDGKKFTEYRMYQAVLFPLTTQSILLPAVKLDMLVYDGQASGRVRTVKSFSSRPIKVVVRQLPAHPKRDQIVVGDYRLEENLSRTKITPGESVNYLFRMIGTGNIAAINAPEMISDPAFDIYSPDINQVVRRSSQQVGGEKSFNYTIVAKKNGLFPLGRLFQWIYFNPRKEEYDTLRSAETIEVIGSPQRVEEAGNQPSKALFDNLEQLDTTGSFINYPKLVRGLINTVIIVLFVGMYWIFKNS